MTGLVDFKIFYLLLIGLSLSISAAIAQNGRETVLDEANIFEKFRDIEIDEFTGEPSHSFPYEFLLNEASIRFEQRSTGITAIIDVLKRIKVHSNHPLEVAEASLVGIPFYFENNIERILNVRGITHHPNGETTELNPDDIRTVDLNSRYQILEFEMPEAEQGAILEYRYTLERRYIEELPDFYFAHRVPTKLSRLYLINENFLRYETVTDNADFEVEYNPEKVDTSSVPLVFTYWRPEPVFIEIWEAENIPGIEASSYLSSPGDVRGKLRFQLSEFGLPRQPLENSWEFVRAQIMRNTNPFEIISEYEELENIGQSIADSYDEPEAAQDSVFNLVNSRAQFNERPELFSDGNLNRVLEGEPSSQAEINLVLLGILHGAGIEANPLYLSGRNFGRINQDFPSLYQFNSMIVHSVVEGRDYFMDASFSESLPNLIPVELYNEQGMLLKETGYEWVDITPEKSVFSFDVQLNAEMDEDGNITGTIEAITRGYPSQQIRRDVKRGEPVEAIIKDTFFEIYNDAEITKASININDDPDIVDATASFAIPEYAVTFSDGMEFKPMLVGHLFENPFESTSRRVPVTLDAPELLSINYKLNLPEGYQMEQLQQSRNTSLTGAELSETYFATGREVEYSFDIDIRRKEFSVDAYSQLRDIYQRWVSLSNNNWYIENIRSR